MTDQEGRPKVNRTLLLRNFLIELVVYGIFVTIYFFLVLRFLSAPLLTLFAKSLPLYGTIALVLIVAQGVLMEYMTSFLLERLGLQRFEM